MHEDEAIDKSEWAPLKWLDERFNFLKNRGRAVHNGRKILPSKYAKHALDRLKEDEFAACDGQNILNEEHHYAGMQYRILNDCSIGRVSAIGINEAAPTQKDAILKKIAIEAQMRSDNLFAVQRITTDERGLSEDDYHMIKMNLTMHVRIAFDDLIEASKPDNIEKILDRRKINP